MRFPDLVAPLTPDEFFARYWTREAVLLRDPSRSFDTAFTWDVLNGMLNATDLSPSTVVVSTEEKVVPPGEFTRHDGTVNPAAVMQFFRDGASFSIRGAGASVPSLRPVVDSLYDTLLEPVHANVYCSPADTQGFRAHYDLHEVFVLQIEGAKHWRVFRPTDDFPVEPWREEDDPSGAQPPYLDVVLQKGDVLYVPRGHWHYAMAVGSVSLHITAGVTCRKATEFLDWLAGELRQRAVWRRNLPMIALTRSTGADAGTAAWGEELRRDLQATLADSDLFQRFGEEMLASVQPRVAVQMPVSGTPGSLRSGDVVFHRPAGRPYRVDAEDEGALTVTAAGASIELEGFSRDFVERIFATPSFTLDDVRAWAPEANPDEIVEFLDSLVGAGLLNATGR